MNNALGVVNDVPGALYFSHLIGTCGEVRQVDFAATIGHKFLRAKAAIHGSDTEFRIGDGLGGVGAVHLHQLHTGLVVVEEHQIFGAAASDKFYLLVAGVQDMALVAGVYLHGPVGAGLDVGQDDFALALGFIAADGGAIMKNFKGHTVHGLVALTVILNHAKPYFRQIFEH